MVIFRTCVWNAQLAHSQKQKEKETKEKNEKHQFFQPPGAFFINNDVGRPTISEREIPSNFPRIFFFPSSPCYLPAHLWMLHWHDWLRLATDRKENNDFDLKPNPRCFADKSLGVLLAFSAQKWTLNNGRCPFGCIKNKFAVDGVWIPPKKNLHYGSSSLSYWFCHGVVRN